jgi:hypothetical protein
MAILLPFAAWPVFLSQLVLPPPGSGRIEALLKLWLGGTVMATAVINLLAAAADYSPVRPGPAPTAGFLPARLVLSLFISCGFWGVVAPILPHEIAICGALITGGLLFLVITALVLA